LLLLLLLLAAAACCCCGGSGGCSSCFCCMWKEQQLVHSHPTISTAAEARGRCFPAMSSDVRASCISPAEYAQLPFTALNTWELHTAERYSKDDTWQSDHFECI
jgi:hypothetical protein